MSLFVKRNDVVGMFVNGAALEDVAEKNHKFYLEKRDLCAEFELSASQATLIMKEVREHLNDVTKSSPLGVRIHCGYISQKFEVDTADTLAENLPLAGWIPENHLRVSAWLGYLEMYRPESLVVLSDCDNTIWAGDIGDIAFAAAVKNKIITWKNAPEIQGYPKSLATREIMAASSPKEQAYLRRHGITPLDYYDWLYEKEKTLSYNYGVQAWSGLTLNDTMKAFTAARTEPGFPQAYDELKSLYARLSQAGVCVGFISASPFFFAMPLLEATGFDAPIGAVEGIDVYVDDPRNPDKPGSQVLLSNLIQSDPSLKNWSDVLKKFGDVKISGMASPVGSFREGKSVAGASIVQRHVQRWNATHQENPLSIADMQLAGVFGDNFGSFSDLTNSEPSESGNDHGMVRAITPLPQGLMLADIYPVVRNKDGSLDFEKRRSTVENFEHMTGQMQALYGSAITLVQPAVYKGETKGFVGVPLPV